MANKPYNYDVEAKVDGGSKTRARHGDIFTSGGYRHTETVIACRDTNSGEMTFLKNLDESGSGYLSIPQQVLAPVTDALTKYKVLISDPKLAPAFNMHLSRYDSWVQENIRNVAVQEMEGWDINVEFIDGKFHQASFCPPNISTSKSFTPPLDWEAIKTFFKDLEKPQKSFEVKVTLNKEDLERYREKYSPGKKHGWLTARPDVGSSWELEPGRSGVRAGENFFHWKLKGPEESREDIVTTITSWLDGFPHSIISEDSVTSPCSASE